MPRYNVTLRRACHREAFDWWNYCANRAESAKTYSFYKRTLRINRQDADRTQRRTERSSK